jgi:hypothetical protein
MSQLFTLIKTEPKVVSATRPQNPHITLFIDAQHLIDTVTLTITLKNRR